jgi:hypothetical protein
MRIMASDDHPVRQVDPFGLLPCRCEMVTVHITNRESMGEDLVECRACGWATRLADLYEGMFPPRDGEPVNK